MTTPYTLKEPLVYRLRGHDGETEQTMTEVTVRKPKARDLFVLDDHKGEVSKAAAMIQQLTGLTARQVGDLGVEDFTALGEIVGGFFPSGHPIGPTF